MSVWYKDYCIDNIDGVLAEIAHYNCLLDHDDLSIVHQLDYFYRPIDKFWDRIDGATRQIVRLYKPVQVGAAHGHYIHSIDVMISPRYV
jgi:hypothetical protein